MKNLAIITSTRAEYGLLQPIIQELRENESNAFKLTLIVTGTHLSPEFGMTVNEIRNAGVRIDFEIPVLTNNETAVNIAENQADVLVKFTRHFAENHYDAIFILGDRYEMQMVAIAATNVHIPIFHYCGGDTTEGAIDESIRHSITKMSYLHFVTNADSMRRVIQLGEDPKRVFNVGSTGIDNILKLKLMEKRVALESVGIEECSYALCTYHPVTLEEQDIKRDIKAFLGAIEKKSELQFIVTKANADKGGNLINHMLDEAAKTIPNLHVFASLGVIRYLSLMKYAEFVLGNSSSGILETPAMHIPTVNIGDRQRGRLQAEGIINCGDAEEEITEAIEKALTAEAKEIAIKAANPYGDGNAAERISKLITEALANETNIKKSFYDMQKTV